MLIAAFFTKMATKKKLAKSRELTGENVGNFRGNWQSCKTFWQVLQRSISPKNKRSLLFGGSNTSILLTSTFV